MKNALRYSFQNLQNHTKGKNHLDSYSTIFCLEMADLQKLNLPSPIWKQLDRNDDNFCYPKQCFDELIYKARSWIGSYGWRRL